MTSHTNAARYVDVMIAAGYSIMLVEGTFPDGAYGIATGFPDTPPVRDPLLDDALCHPNTKRSRRALAAELRRRGLVITMTRHEVTR